LSRIKPTGRPHPLDGMANHIILKVAFAPIQWPGAVIAAQLYAMMKP
jgi:hypothetical protein